VSLVKELLDGHRDPRAAGLRTLDFSKIKKKEKQKS
jgi:hypothetical protein